MAQVEFLNRGGSADALRNRKKMKAADEELLEELEEEAVEKLAAEIQIEGGYKKPELRSIVLPPRLLHVNPMSWSSLDLSVW